MSSLYGDGCDVALARVFGLHVFDGCDIDLAGKNRVHDVNAGVVFEGAQMGHEPAVCTLTRTMCAWPRAPKS